MSSQTRQTSSAEHKRRYLVECSHTFTQWCWK